MVTMAPKSSGSIANNPLRVALPNGDTVQSTHTCTLALPQLPAKAREGHIISGLAAYSLLSVVKLCDAGCDVTLTKTDCTVRMRGCVLMTDKKYTKTGLWMLPLSMDESTISPAALSTISQLASDVLQPIAAAARHRLQAKHNLLASANSRHEDEINNVSTRGTRNTHSCLDSQQARNQVITKEHIYNLTPTINMEELAKYHHQSVCSPPK